MDRPGSAIAAGSGRGSDRISSSAKVTRPSSSASSASIALPIEPCARSRSDGSAWKRDCSRVRPWLRSDIVEREGDEAEFLSLLGIDRLADRALRAVEIGWIGLEARLQPGQAVAQIGYRRARR